MYCIYPLPLHKFYIYICSVLISLKTNKHSICDGNFFNYHYMFVLISTIKGTSLSLSLSHFDFSIILIFYLLKFRKFRNCVWLQTRYNCYMKIIEIKSINIYKNKYGHIQTIIPWIRLLSPSPFMLFIDWLSQLHIYLP